MTVNQLPVLIPLALLLPAFVIPLVGMWRRESAYVLALGGTAVAFAAAVAGLLHVLRVGEIRYSFGGWAPPIGIEYVLDGLSGFLAVVITGIGFVVLAASRRSVLAETPDRFVYLYAISMLLLAGLAGMVLTGDLFNLYVFLEISSLSVYALIATGERRAPVAAFRYLILGSIGGGFFLLGVGFIYFSAGTLNMADIAARLPALYESRAVVAATTLMVVGLGLKMALFPLHSWLPDAYHYSPSAVASLIAPISTKVAAYAIIRLVLDVFHPEYLRDMLPVTFAIGWLAAAGILFASFMAIAQTDLRRMLAYSSVGQIAYVGLGIGMANPLAMIGALLHIMNHAVMKACLFLVAGAIRLRTGRSEIPRFAGLGRAMPWTMVGFTIAALSMIGIPPTAGFFSKWYLVLGGVDARNWVFIGVIVVSSLMSAVYFFRILEVVYGGAAREAAPVMADGGEPMRDDAPPSVVGPILVLAAAVILLGLANVVIVREVLEPVVAPLAR